MSALLEADEIAEIRTSDVPGDSAHIVRSVAGETSTPQAIVLQARIEGTTVEALCGYVWVPQKDPAPLPVCSTCVDIYRNGYGHDGEDMPDA